MNIGEYMSQRFASLGVVLSDADLLDMGVIDRSDELDSQEKITDAYIKFISSLGMILLRPDSISEGGVSISRAKRDDILLFYEGQCKRLGLTPVISNRPKVRFR